MSPVDDIAGYRQTRTEYINRKNTLHYRPAPKG